MIGSNARFTGLVSFGDGATTGELLTEIAVVQVRVCVMPVTQTLV
jgi:hypothetical protein